MIKYHYNYILSKKHDQQIINVLYNTIYAYAFILLCIIIVKCVYNIYKYKQIRYYDIEDLFYQLIFMFFLRYTFYPTIYGHNLIK